MMAAWQRMIIAIIAGTLLAASSLWAQQPAESESDVVSQETSVEAPPPPDPPPHEGVGAGWHGPPPSGERSPHDRPPRHKLTDEQLDDTLELLEIIRPELAAQIAEAREKHPERVAELLHPWRRRVHFLMALKRRDPEMFQMRIEHMRLDSKLRLAVADYRQALQDKEQEQVEQLETEIENLVRERFEAKQKLRAREIDKLEARIEQVRNDLKESSEKKEEIIVQEMSRLTAPPEEESDQPDSPAARKDSKR